MSFPSSWKFWLWLLLMVLGLSPSQERMAFAQGVPVEICDDLEDNDADGLIDCNDPDCEGSGICDVIHTFGVSREISYEILSTIPEETYDTFGISREISYEIIGNLPEEEYHTFAISREITYEVLTNTPNEVFHTYAISREITFEMLLNIPEEEYHTFAISREITFDLDSCPPVVDCNGNGIDDSCDILLGSVDLIDATGAPNPNGIPDECDVVSEVFLRGDVDGLPGIQIGDAISNFNYLISGNDVQGVDCQERYDVNGDLQLDVGDVVWTISYLFLSGMPPAAPFPNCDRLAVYNPNSPGCLEAACAP